MNALLLEEHERRRFIKWLEHEIETERGLLQQMDKLPLPEAFVAHRKQQVAAFVLVHRYLSSIESQTIERPTSTPREGEKS